MIRVAIPVVILTALAQALLVWPALTPLSGPFFLVAAGSFLVTVAAVWLIASAAGGARPGWRGLLWSAVSLAAALVAALVTPALVPVVLVAALFVLPGAVDAAAHPLDGFKAVRRQPVRLIVMALLSILALFICWVIALLLGFFVTGPLGAGATWLVFGIVGVAVLGWWSANLRKTA